MMNIVLVGAAGSGKGTQGDLIKDEFDLFKISAGDALREYRKNKKGKYTNVINTFIDKGQLVPVEITNEIIGTKIEKEVFKTHKYNGLLFDGYPRQMEQLIFLDEFLKKNNTKIDLVIYIKVPVDSLIKRLSGRYTCNKCGEIYNKYSKPAKIKDTCDICSAHDFSVRADDQDINAIKTRFKIFENETSVVLKEYEKQGKLFEIDGDRTPTDIANEIKERIQNIKKMK